MLAYPDYFHLLNQPLPSSATSVLEALLAERLVSTDDTGRYAIANIGAILLARDLRRFPGLERKALRIVEYEGAGRIRTLREHVVYRGYAAGFDELVGHINARLPSNEVIERAFRRAVPMYPELAVREAIANALIHQDFTIGGAGPMVEIFDGRIEFTNPGAPLVDVQRLLDSPPRSRNDRMASLMRRMGICEERGSGVDKIVFQTEFFQLPAPLFETPEGATRMVLFAHQSLAEMSPEDRVRACYLHACLRHVQRQDMTNSSVRERFGIEKKNSAQASRLVKEAVESGLVVPFDANAARRHMRSVPFWADGRGSRPPGVQGT